MSIEVLEQYLVLGIVVNSMIIMVLSYWLLLRYIGNRRLLKILKKLHLNYYI